MYDENGNDWTLMTVLTLIFLFTVLGGWEDVLGWLGKVYNKTPNVLRKIIYVMFLMTAIYFGLKYV